MAVPKNIGQTPEEREEALKEKFEEIDFRQKELETMAIAKANRMPYIDLEGFPIDQKALVLVPFDVALKTGAVAFYRDEDKTVRVGLYIPEDFDAQNEIRDILDTAGYTPEFYVVSEKSLRRGLSAYKAVVSPDKQKGKVAVGAEELRTASEEIKALSELSDKLKKVPVSQVLETILAGAVVGDASDIHFEPEENIIILRFRIDGVLNEVAQLSREAYPRLVSRIKLEAGLKINVSDRPQDGRLSIVLDGEELDIRVSVLPTAYGETIVLRLLGTGAVGLTLDDLGVRENAEKVLREQISKPNGMILITGPTGSGKTTTLYAALQFLNREDKKIITLENPIEYQIEGISQTQIDPVKGLTFAAALRSVLRQDPDVVMVGEIRDLETAEIAMQAALTGHIVFSTLHTNDSSGVIPRLIDLGVRPFTVAPALNAVVAQRLVRRIRENCKTEYEPSEEEIAYLKEKLGNLYPKEGVQKLYGVGKCEGAIGDGYEGRIAVFEIFEVDSEIEHMINERAAAQDIADYCTQKQGMVTMLQDGLLRAIEGVTTIEEVKRVLD